MTFDIQPTLENDIVLLSPLQPEDFETLYSVASDPAIWAQHPNKNRYEEPVFRTFFTGAIESKGAFKVIEKASGKVIGSTRFYDHKDDSIFIGYTFYATSCWGTGINKAVKAIMLDYAFQFVSKVQFHIGANNVRSQIAISRVGAKKVAEEEVAYVGEPSRHNFVYEIRKEQWNVNALHTAGLVVLKDEMLLLAFSKNKKAWYLPGGKIDYSETSLESVQREVMEELNLQLDTSALQYYCHISAPAYGERNLMMEQDCYLYQLNEEITPGNEIGAVQFFDYESYLAEPAQVVGVLEVFKRLKADQLMS